MRIVSALLLALASPIASADVLTDLRATLAQLVATTPVHGSLELTSATRSTEDDTSTAGKATVSFDMSDAGLRILYPHSMLVQAGQEARAEAVDPARSTPARSGISRLRPLQVAELLDAASALHVVLQNATVVSATSSTYRGRPARLVLFRVTPRLSKAMTKHMKKLDGTLSVWIGEDGVPVAAELSMNAKVSFLLITFESEQKESFMYLRSGDRLVVTRYEQTQKGAGFGQHEQSQISEVLTLQ